MHRAINLNLSRDKFKLSRDNKSRQQDGQTDLKTLFTIRCKHGGRFTVCIGAFVPFFRKSSIHGCFSHLHWKRVE